MKFRKLRIAWSVVWGVLAIAAVLAWIRSYYWSDYVSLYSRGQDWSLHLQRGNLGAWVIRIAAPPTNAVHWSICETPSTSDNPYLMFDGTQIRAMQSFAGFHYGSSVAVTLLMIPFPVVFGATLLAGSIPYMKRRFSLRALLIAITLVAVVLGLFVWLR